MKLCLSCRQLSPSREAAGDTIFCSHCGDSFGVRRCRSCKKKPGSSRHGSHCSFCGGTNLSEATAYLELGWLVRLLAWGMVFLIGRWLCLSLLAGRSTRTTTPAGGPTWLDALLIGAVELCGRILIVGGTLYVLLLLTSSVISLVFPVNVGKSLNSLPTAGLKVAGQLLVAGVRFGGRLLYRLVEGGHGESQHKAGK